MEDLLKSSPLLLANHKKEAARSNNTPVHDWSLYGGEIITMTFTWRETGRIERIENLFQWKKRRRTSWEVRTDRNYYWRETRRGHPWNFIWRSNAMFVCVLPSSLLLSSSFIYTLQLLRLCVELNASLALAIPSALQRVSLILCTWKLCNRLHGYNSFSDV